MLKKTFVKMTGVYNRYVNNERGAQALEWVALGLVVLAVMGAIASGIGKDTSLGQTIMSKLSELVSKIGAGE
ncbi:hypothetical protein M3172_22930 [Mesobacillus subterraneus]|jgi:hypothetical protein|uniref:hypothetical protein n=1 Tax=Mesobacillus subterraneus TaxID=285983 RepID=UPI00203BEE82|nr:hypothetical protein [Mesobacillus subterraneus]MCM3576027.1 hypothetical protein [Mesobacillus subterraneus]